MLEIPPHGRSHSDVLAAIDALAASDPDPGAGRLFSLAYHASDAHDELLQAAYSRLMSTNALNPLTFSALRAMEAEVVRMTATLLHGDAAVAGTMTSGGSESIALAVLAYREEGRANGIDDPTIVLPESAHPAFRKACHLFGVNTELVPVRDDFRVSADAVAGVLTDQVVAIVGSAPGYPHGVVDPIDELGALARDSGVGLHVDACLGGFLLPWLERLGEPIPTFDFRVGGVTSISADVHKYGFAAKGASTILYRSADLRRRQFYATTSWPGGLYASPTLAGTRPGGAIAAAWASLQSLGQDGYLDLARQIRDATAELIGGIEQIEDLRMVVKPDGAVIAFTSDALDPFAIGEQLDGHGWHVDRQIRPASLHLIVTPPHASLAKEFLGDLARSVEAVRADPSLTTQGQAPMYGMMASVPAGEDEDMTAFVLQMLDGLYEA